MLFSLQISARSKSVSSYDNRAFLDDERRKSVASIPKSVTDPLFMDGVSVYFHNIAAMQKSELEKLLLEYPFAQLYSVN